MFFFWGGGRGLFFGFVFCFCFESQRNIFSLISVEASAESTERCTFCLLESETSSKNCMN